MVRPPFLKFSSIPCGIFNGINKEKIKLREERLAILHKGSLGKKKRGTLNLSLPNILEKSKRILSLQKHFRKPSKFSYF